MRLSERVMYDSLAEFPADECPLFGDFCNPSHSVTGFRTAATKETRAGLRGETRGISE